MNDKLKTETIELKPVRIFFCGRHKINLTRDRVRKVGGEYFCKTCNEPVVDKTDTETGREILRWI